MDLINVLHDVEIYFDPTLKSLATSAGLEPTSAGGKLEYTQRSRHPSYEAPPGARLHGSVLLLLLLLLLANAADEDDDVGDDDDDDDDDDYYHHYYDDDNVDDDDDED
ncbi:hypothetical protein SprV_0902692900 [Sparganum proliferum]